MKEKVRLKAEILSAFSAQRKATLNYKQISSKLHIRDKQIRKLILEILDELVKDGVLTERERGRYEMSRQKRTVTGRLEMTKKGVGYVVNPELKTDIFIDRKFLGNALHGDEVLVEISDRSRRQDEGRIINVITRSARPVTGIVRVGKGTVFLIPDDQRFDTDIYIRNGDRFGDVNSQRAVVKIADWPETAKSPFGEIIELLGTPETNEAEIKAILISNGIRYTFPQAVLDEAERIQTIPDDGEIANRRDFRSILTFTIDPVDAKDFDDALSFEEIADGKVRIGVHIADVSHYVRENGQLDKEARARGNSVYLVDRVIPMLPEHLSNVVCSLRPNEDKLTFSSVFDIDKEGNVSAEWFGKSVIKSKRRFTYEQAQEAILTGQDELSGQLRTINNIAVNLRKQRMKSGALEVGGAELRFELDPSGIPLRTYKKVIQDSNKLIEEFMLLANKHVAIHIGKPEKGASRTLIYRVHDLPDAEKLEQFASFVSRFGFAFKCDDVRKVAQIMNRLFDEMKNEPSLPMVQQMAIKSMAKAVYDTENIGHYGLAFRYYAHFTSPIRRYADLVVHRILQQKLTGQPEKYKDLRETAKHISLTERQAVDAERASVKFFMAKMLEPQLGQRFHGLITGLTEWGLYVELTENLCEGMVSLKSIAYDRFYFDEASYRVIGTRSGEIFNLGDKVEVELVSVSVGRRQIDLDLVY